MADYSEERISAYNDIAEAGTTVQIIQSASASTYDPITGTYAQASSLATFTQPALITGFDGDYAHNALVQINDLKFVIPGLRSDLETTLALKQSDKIYWDNRYWNIISTNAVSPSGTPILYKAHVRE